MESLPGSIEEIEEIDLNDLVALAVREGVFHASADMTPWTGIAHVDDKKRYALKMDAEPDAESIQRSGNWRLELSIAIGGRYDLPRIVHCSDGEPLNSQGEPISDSLNKEIIEDFRSLLRVARAS